METCAILIKLYCASGDEVICFNTLASMVDAGISKVLGREQNRDAPSLVFGTGTKIRVNTGLVHR